METFVQFTRIDQRVIGTFSYYLNHAYISSAIQNITNGAASVMY